MTQNKKHANLKILFKISLFAIITLFMITGCRDDNNADEGSYKSGEGFFILNEGGYGKANASVSYHYYQGDSTEHLIYEASNAKKLGDVLQSMTIHDDYTYLVVNNSAYVKVVETNTFEEVATIEGFVSPRFMQPIGDDEAYVSDLFANKIWVVDLKNNVISDSISLSGWTEEMVMVDGKVYVSSPTLFGSPTSSQIYVIDPGSHTVTDTISVGVNPYNLIVDNDDNIWVFCQGDAFADPIVKPGLFRISPNEPDMPTALNLPNLAIAYNSSLVFDESDEMIYLLYGNVYKMHILETTLSDSPFIEADGRTLYGLGFDPKDNTICISDAKDYNQSGDIFRYETNGQLLDEFEAGIIPSKFIFF